MRATRTLKSSKPQKPVLNTEGQPLPTHKVMFVRTARAGAHHWQHCPRGGKDALEMPGGATPVSAALRKHKHMVGLAVGVLAYPV